MGWLKLRFGLIDYFEPAIEFKNVFRTRQLKNLTSKSKYSRGRRWHGGRPEGSGRLELFFVSFFFSRKRKKD
jgi:hypothetical protein